MSLSCSDNFLDAKSDKTLIVPTSLTEMEGMLNNSRVINLSNVASQQLTDDALFMPEGTNLSQDLPLSQLYTWLDEDPELFKPDWQNAYQSIFIVNSVLDVASNFQASNPVEQLQLDGIVGAAYFLRGRYHWELLQQFAPIYHESNYDELGVVLKLNSNVMDFRPRNNVKESYDQVLTDLLAAIELLPASTPHRFRPNITAGHALLARVYLSMSNYAEANFHAKQALNRQSTLMDYNTLTRANPSANPFARFNSEVIYHTELGLFSSTYTGTFGGFVDPMFYNSYDDNDLRKNLFFGQFGEFYRMTGLYTGQNISFGGLATDELHLIMAETEVRLGNIQEGMYYLNTLLETRWLAGSYIPFSASNEVDALQIIFEERRKQLLSRGLRWTDLKRQNLDPRFAVTLSRSLNGITYSLPPNDPRYSFLIPATETVMNPLIVQNPR